MHNFSKPDISLSLVKKLIKEQYPEYSLLPVTPVKESGWDNRTFHLGKELSIRLPSAECYSEQVFKEQYWLPILSQNLPLMIPKPIALGKPSKEYPWHWSIYRWIEGDNANIATINDIFEISVSLSLFLKELHKIDVTGGPLPGKHNFYRGGNLKIYDNETREAIFTLQNIINKDKARFIWDTALSSRWNKTPVWIHGDFSPGNILIKNGKLHAIIDFGCTGIGDPACDLVLAWTFFSCEHRENFKSNINLDNQTWERAKGWALWKSLITLQAIDNKTSMESLKQIKVIDDLMNSTI